MKTADVFKVLNPETGELITIDDNAGKRELSEARKIIVMQIKELEARQEVIDTMLAPYIQEAFDHDDKTLCNFWSVVAGARRFNTDLFLTKAPKKMVARREAIKSELDEIEQPYKVAGAPYIKFPKFS